MLKDALTQPIAKAQDSVSGKELVVFEPYWSPDGRFPVRFVERGRMRKAAIMGRKQIVDIVPFDDKRDNCERFGLTT